MAVDTKPRTLTINSWPNGLIGKTLVPGEAFLTRRRGREMVREAFRIREIAGIDEEDFDHPESRLGKFIQTYNFPAVRSVIAHVMEIAHKGLQDSFEIMAQEGLGLSKKLKGDKDFIRKHAAQLNDNQKVLYKSFLSQVLKTLDQTAQYINELEHELEGRENRLSSLNVLAGKYYRKRNLINKFFSIFDKIYEAFEERGVGKDASRLLKMEDKIVSIDEAGKISESKIEELLKLDKKFAADFRKTYTRTFVYMFFIIRGLALTIKKIDIAIKSIKLPDTFRDEYSEVIEDLLSSERKALASINKIRLQLESEANDTLGLIR